MTDISNKVWAELYRPTTFEDYIFSDSALGERVNEWEVQGIFPNLVLAGIQGTGKSSLARVLVNEFGVTSSDTLFVDGSVHNKVDDVRDKIVAYADIAPMGNFKVVVVEEAHRLTKDAQSALFETVERTSDYIRFIFTTNYPNKLLAPLLSRCQVFHFNSFDEDGVFDLIERIMEEQGIEADDTTIENITRHVEANKPDIRSIISSIQYSFVDGKVLPPSNSIKSSSIDDWEKLWSSDSLDLSAVKELVYYADQTNYELFYTVLYEKGLHHFTDRGQAVVYISDYLSRAMNVNTQGIQSIHLEALLYVLENEVGLI